MIEMNQEPAEIEYDNKSFNDYCTQEESMERLLICKSCNNFKILDIITICNSCGCNINMLISHKSKTCPESSW